MHICPNKKVYIGITSKSNPSYRWGKDGKGYKDHNTHFWNAIQKYGWENIEHKVLATNLTKEDACLLEQTLINRYNATDRDYGYNKSLGGECSAYGTHRCLSEETKAKISKAQTGKKRNPESIKKAVISRKWYKHSAETKNKIALSHEMPVEQLSITGTIIEEYPSILIASKTTNIHKQNICKCCKGLRKTAGGFMWRYKGGG